MLTPIRKRHPRVDVVLDFADPPENWRPLGYGYRVDVQVILFEGEVLKLPLGALFRHGDEWAVFVAQEAKARLRLVVVGQRNSLSFEVREGLRPGKRPSSIRASASGTA